MSDGPRTVNDVMTHKVVAVRGGAEFKDIVRTMREWHVSALPVVDDGQRVLGVVSEADLLPKEEYRDAEDCPPDRGPRSAKARGATAEQVMTAPAVTVRADASPARAARAMAHAGVKRLPVVDGEGVLRGVVSRSDLLKVFLRSDEDIEAEVRRDIDTHLLALPVRPVDVRVRNGVVTLSGQVRDTTLVPVLTRLVRTVEGVVDVECDLEGPLRRPDLDPDLGDVPDTPAR
ncbi:CBS domain-containing protein [Streptomyces sp. NPDC005017]|uniref:CBS domain-containing protein n=1 Tax=Streptomyces sp. NPDC005017 TaxID=3364706 RepID=UPI0036D1DA9D